MERKDEYVISKEKALDLAITRVIYSTIGKMPKLENWEGSLVRTEPLEIFDINGQLLFFEYSVEKDDKIVGRMKISANKVLGPAIYTMEIGPRSWNLEQARAKALDKLQEKYKGMEIEAIRLVCYSYPKLGFLIMLQDPSSNDEVSLILDVVSNESIPLIMTEEKRLGIGVWSLYDTIKENDKAQRVSRWESDNNLSEFLIEKAREAKVDIRNRLTGLDMEKLINFLNKSLPKDFVLGKNLLTSKILRIEPTIIRWPPPPKTIDLLLNGQEHSCWCAVASGQMILRHHNYFYEQSEIAIEMSTIPQPQGIATWNPGFPDLDPCGTTYGGITTGMESLSRNYLAAEIDQTPSWNENKDEIDNDQPLVSCTPGHARVCAGYMMTAFRLYTRVPFGIKFFIQKFLYIYDPWPPNANNTFCNPQGGAEYWEDWEATTYWDSVYLRNCTGTMACKD